MNAETIVQDLVDRGILSEGFRDEALPIIRQGIAQKGMQAVADKFAARWKRISGNPARLMQLMLSDLPDRTEPAKTEYEAKTEIEIEEEDYKLYSGDPLDVRFKRPHDFDDRPLPTYLFRYDGQRPYAEFEEKVRLYVQNTYIVVREKAQSEGISMHEWCRRNGMKYEGLII